MNHTLIIMYQKYRPIEGELVIYTGHKTNIPKYIEVSELFPGMSLFGTKIFGEDEFGRATYKYHLISFSEIRKPTFWEYFLALFL